MSKLKIEGTTAIKDSENSALLNSDVDTLYIHKRMKKAKRNESERIKKLENEVGEIKDMLKTIINKL